MQQYQQPKNCYTYEESVIMFFKSLMLFLVFVISLSAHAEDLNEKVARNASNCLVGHIASESEMYESGETSKYILLIERMLGSAKAMEMIEKSVNNLEASVRMLSSSKKEEGDFLVENFCPAIDKVIAQAQ